MSATAFFLSCRVVRPRGRGAEQELRQQDIQELQSRDTGVQDTGKEEERLPGESSVSLAN
jgi:hypothetical protein